MSKANLNHTLYLCLLVLVTCFLPCRSLAQDASNRRGFQPGNSFAIGDFETINTTNGNLMLKFPLGGLPAGRNGLSAGINLYYNSKLMDSELNYFPKENEECEMVGTEPAILVCPYYQKLVLRDSDQGGWKFGTGYGLKLIDRHSEFNNVPQEQRPQCGYLGVWGGSPGYFEWRYHYKLMLMMPDGSSHEMRPNGWSDGNGNDPLGDYFDIRPDGFWDTCMSQQWYPNTITYYSIDGSFLRLDIQHDSNSVWFDNPWTLYFPDGSKVTTSPSQPQRLYDRNDNYVEFLGNEIRDQFGRSVNMGSYSDNGVHVDTITSQGFGETLTWEIRWKTISVLKNYWPCNAAFNCDLEVQQQEPYATTRTVVDTITLPAQAGGLTYTFTYNAPDYVPGPPPTPSHGWGELSGITLPSGAHIDYLYEQDGSQPLSATPDVLRNAPNSKVLTYNQDYDGGSIPTTETWSYGFSSGGSLVIGPDGGATGIGFFDTGGSFWNSGLTHTTVNPDGSKTETIWAKNNLAANTNTNPHPKTVLTSISSGTNYVKTSIKDYKYDKNGNVTRVAEYDWVDYQSVPRDTQGFPTGIPAVSPTRVILNTYFNLTPESTQVAGSNTNVYWSSGSPRVKSAIATTEVRRIVSGSEVPVSRTEYTYDNAATPANVTQVRSWDSSKGVYSSPLTASNSLTVTSQYNAHGMPTLITDPRGLKIQTTYGLIGTASDLYPTQIKSAYQTSQERTETREYDFGTGLVTRMTDVDNNVASATSYDVLGRPVLVRVAEGKPEETRAATEYSDVARRVITRTDLSSVGDGKLVSIQHFDQLGRVRLSRQLEDATQSATDESTGIKVQTRYAYSGSNSFVLVSNPYRAATSGGAGSETTMGWTRSKSDNGGRVIEVQTFGGTSLPAPWGSSTTSTGTVTTGYDANFTTVADQAQKQRRSVVDGLGRLIRVDEPDANGNLGAATTPNQPTHYAYDVLGNLTQVTQSDGTTTQNRNFTYTSLSRLISAVNPESGTTSYKYDESGNLVVKTDARNISAHYSYDALNRITRRWYNGSGSISDTTHNSPAPPSSVGATDEVRFYYDSQTLPPGSPTYSRGFAAGRLVAQVYGSGSNGDYYAFDVLGRATLKYQQTGSINYRMMAAYNRANEITSLTYPSDRTITNTFDTAGRLLSFSGTIGNGSQQTYSSGILYSASGGLSKEQFGTSTPVYNKQFYNSRGQLAEIRVSTSYTGPADYSADRGAIVNNFSNQCAGICLGSSMTDNNGNLRKQEIYIPNQQMRWQQYEYDSLNRLSWAREVLNSTEQWKQQFVYDRWGNRTIDAAVTYGQINEKAFTVNATNNRLGVPSGQPGVMTYDAAGSLTGDTYTGAGDRTYNAENKIVSAWGGNNQAQLYSYDGSGQRIKRIVDGVATWHVYGLGGELLAEYPANGAATTPQKEYGYRSGQLLVTAGPGTVSPTTRQNFALRANGGSASASSEIASGCSNWPARGVIDGDRKGSYWGNNGGWADSSSGSFANDWLQVDFDSAKTIDELDIFTLQDNPNNPSEPTEAMTFSIYGLTTYSVSYWNGSAWSNIPEASVVGNNKVWRKFTFAPITTTKIRVFPQAAVDNGYSRLTEVEAWGSVSVPAQTNVALRSSGAVAIASSEIAAGCDTWPARGANDGDRKGTYWGSTGGWADSTAGNFTNDWLQIEFSGSKTIHEIDVFTLQDNYSTPIEPVESTTFSTYGLTAYDVSYWNGTSWVPIPETVVTGNNKVWRRFTFSPITTTKIRVFGRAAADNGFSRIAEVEAWSATEASGGNSLQWLVSDHLGTPRMVLDQTGSLAGVRRHDYLPFGEELFAPLHGRATSQGYASGDGVRQQFAGQERDVETGLDFVQARHYQSVQGRFTSPDPISLQEEMLSDPQRFNLYAYVRNSPLTLVDPTGEAIELTGDENERWRKLDLLRKMVGSVAGAYLYENKGKDGKYYVGIYTKGPDGKGADFESINAAAGDLVGIIRDRLVAEIQFVAPGQVEEIGTIGAIKSPGATGVDQYGRAKIFLLDPSKAPGYLPGELISNGEPLAMETSDVLAHELGHVASKWGLAAGSDEGVAIAFENDARLVRDPKSATRESYTKKGDLKTSAHRFRIPLRRWPR